MLDNTRIQISNNKKALRRIFHLTAILLFLSFAQSTIYAQFNSGSTGADGAFNPTANTTLQIPESGVFNFTTVNIPLNITVTFTRNSRNTPVTILASGNVIIAGRINIDGANGSGRFGGLGGPGGFKGGNGGTPIDVLNGTTGDGPGGGGGAIAGTTGSGDGGGGGFLTSGSNGGAGGNGIAGIGGPRYGSKTLLPLIGGSGGGGGSSIIGSQTVIGGGGGGGGGAILIASSGTISFPNNSDSLRGISAQGGESPFANTDFSGGTGSGGAIRIIANTITGSPCLDVSDNSTGTPAASFGVIRIEAFDLSQYVPRCSTTAQTLGNPNPVTLSNIPTLKITSVGGINAPANPVGSNSSVNPDIIVPTSVPNPVQVAIQATNIPVGTVVQVRLVPESGTSTVVNSTPLSGSTSSSTATATLTLPATGISVIRAFVTLDVAAAGLSKMLVEGERIKQVEIGSSFGGSPELTYILESGRRVSTLK